MMAAHFGTPLPGTHSGAAVCLGVMQPPLG
jgi:hypothetical protein